MKLYALLMTCTVIAGFSGNSFAAHVGSPRPVAQENFQKLIKTNECPACDLAGVVLTRVDLSGANLEEANLAGAKLYLTDLSGANLKNANLQGAGLGGADLAGADLRGANLTGAVLEGAYLKGAQIDGSIITHKPYEEEDLPGVSEKKYVDDESRGKNVPYTQDVVVEDRRDLSDASPVVPAIPQVQQGKTSAEPDMMKSSTAASSKTLLPMADAVVHTPDSEKSAAVVETTETAPARDESVPETGGDTGIWGTVTSFFGGSSPDSDDEAEVVTPAGQEATAQDADQPVDEIVVTETDEIVIADDAQSEPVLEEVAVESTVVEPTVEEPVQEDSGEKADDSGFWGSVTSIFSSDDDGKESGQDTTEKTNEEVTVETDEVAADRAVQTGRDELAPDAGVMTMIEQIEGPPPKSEEIEVVEQDIDVQEEIVVSGSEEVIAQGDEAAAVPAATEVKSADATAAEPAAGSTVSDMISQIEADQETETAPTGDVVYGVETPEQARAKQQMSVDRLLDEDRCVDCELAGVDLAGKRLGNVDLERANLQEANLEGTDLSEANLKGVNFSGANLKNADLREADLYLADFTGADLTGARLGEALIDSVDFTDATGVNLEGAIKEE